MHTFVDAALGKLDVDLHCVSREWQRGYPLIVAMFWINVRDPLYFLGYGIPYISVICELSIHSLHSPGTLNPTYESSCSSPFLPSLRRTSK